MKKIIWLSCRLLKQSPRSIKIVSLISMVGIALAVATLFLTISVVDGFSKHYQRSIIDFSAHLTLIDDDGQMLNETEMIPTIQSINNGLDLGIQHMTPVIYTAALVTAHNNIRGIQIKGIDWHTYKDVAHAQYTFTPDGKDRFINGEGVVILGDSLAKLLGLKIGDSVQLVIPSPTALDVEKIDYNQFLHQFTLGGVFKTGLYDFDSQFILMPISLVSGLFGLKGELTTIEMTLLNPDEMDKTQRLLEDNLPSHLKILTWRDINAPIFEAVEMEKGMFIIIMGILVVVASFNVMGSVVIRILHKRQIISILRAIGLPLKQMILTFLLQGLMIGGIGTGVGLLLGYGLGVWVSRFELVAIPEEIYFIKTLPMEMSGTVAVLILVGAIVATLFSSLLASRRVGKYRLIEGLNKPF